MSSALHRRILLPCLLLLGFEFSVRALTGPTDFVVNLPFDSNEATPAWLGHPATSPGTFATLDLPIVPPDPDASLLVTVFFQEKSGGFLRISWQNEADVQSGPGELSHPDEQVLCDNFYEGIGMSNQRSLLVTPETMKATGSLHFQCGDSALGIQRIQLEWLENQTGITSPSVPDILVTPANGATKLLSDLSGQPPVADTPSWQDRIVKVPVTDVPLRVEQGVEFNLQMATVPATARLTLKEAGLPWGQHFVVWMNGKRAGTVSPSVPDLTDQGFATVKKAGTPYVGWRDGTLFVNVAALIPGLNTLQFSVEPDDLTDPSTSAPSATDSDTAPLAVKDVSFQLDYPVTAVDSSPETTTNAPSTSAVVPNDSSTSTVTNVP